MTVKILAIPKPAINGELGSKYPKNGYPIMKPAILLIMTIVSAAISSIPIKKSSGFPILPSRRTNPFTIDPKI